MCSLGKQELKKKLDGFQEDYGHSVEEDVTCYSYQKNYDMK